MKYYLPGYQGIISTLSEGGNLEIYPADFLYIQKQTHFDLFGEIKGMIPEFSSRNGQT